MTRPLKLTDDERRTVESLQAQLNVIIARAEARQEEPIKSLRPVLDGLPDKAVIMFNVEYSGSRRLTSGYTYVALKINNSWYLTGTIRPFSVGSSPIFARWIIDRRVTDITLMNAEKVIWDA